MHLGVIPLHDPMADVAARLDDLIRKFEQMIREQAEQLSAIEQATGAVGWVLSEVDERYQEVVTYKHRQQPLEMPIVAARAVSGSVIHLVAVVREPAISVDILRKIDLPDSSVSRSLARRLLETPHYQVTVHTGHIEEDQARRKSFTFFVSKEMWRSVKPLRGDLVFATLSGEQYLSSRPFWRCTALSWPT